MRNLRDNMQELVDEVAEGGVPYLVCANTPIGSMQEIKDSIAVLNKTGEACKKAGVTFAYHNHDFEFTPIDGKLPYDLMLAETDKNLVKMELDLYWIVKANQDPLAYMKKHPDRFALFHVKDLDKTPNRGITEVGHGVIDFKTIFANMWDEETQSMISFGEYKKKKQAVLEKIRAKLDSSSK